LRKRNIPLAKWRKKLTREYDKGRGGKFAPGSRKEKCLIEGAIFTACDGVQ
jgi:hypothetical protein